jgi:Arc/MetJ-type ribon-helix-helix transcriptional regulator
MPRGNPKKPMVIRLDPALAAEVRARAGEGRFSAAVAEGLRLWLARDKRQKPKGDPLARHLYPPAAREIAARKEAT